jgi:hypothetical protein
MNAMVVTAGAPQRPDAGTTDLGPRSAEPDWAAVPMGLQPVCRASPSTRTRRRRYSQRRLGGRCLVSARPMIAAFSSWLSSRFPAFATAPLATCLAGELARLHALRPIVTLAGSGAVVIRRRGDLMTLQHPQGALQGLDRAGPLGGQLLHGLTLHTLQF